MKILHTVEFYHPSTGGMQAVCQELSERLVKLGHEVTVATAYLPERNFTELNGVKIESFKISGKSASGYQSEPGEIERYKNLLLTGDFDVITNFAAQQWATDIALPLLPEIKAKKIFVPTGFSGLYQPLFRDYFSQMKVWIKNYDWQIFLSNNYRDINFTRDLGLKNFSIIPNGAAAEEFSVPQDETIRTKLGIPKNHFLIVQIGSHTGVKGHSAARTIFAKANIPHSTLLIIGNNLSKHGGCSIACAAAAKNWINSRVARERDQQFINSELTREETVAILKDAQLFLFPSNIECSPIVLFEAMAAKVPFLTTAVGNAAEIINWSGGGELLPTKDCYYINDNQLKFIIKSAIMFWQRLFIGEKPAPSFGRADIKASAKLLEELYRDPARREKLANQGFKSWQEKFTWKKITLQYEQIYKKIINR